MVATREMINTFIDKRELPMLSGERDELMAFDPYLNARLSDSKIEGLKLWEYGKLLNFIQDFRGLRMLDVGPGDSTFCLFLASRGAQVITSFSWFSGNSEPSRKFIVIPNGGGETGSAMAARQRMRRPDLSTGCRR